MAIKPKILVRAGFNPLLKYSPIDYMSKNIVGHNVGNLIYAYGVMNVLWTEQVVIDQIYDKNKFTDVEADFINDNYNAFVIPLADAFRTQYIPYLKAYTSLINKLKIPVIVIGVGLRTTYEPKFDTDLELNRVVKDFVTAVLNHSSKLGLRGGITGHYLKYLGFKEDRDYIPIGCPSLYMYGNDIKLRSVSSLLNNLKESKLLVNTNMWAKNLLGKYTSYIDDFMKSAIDLIPNHFLIQQTIQELKYLYLGKIYSQNIRLVSIFTDREFQMLHKEDRVKWFTDVPSWIKFCFDADLIVGNRFHGTVAAILAGTPHIFLPIDGRTRELSDYHHFTTIPFHNLHSHSNFDDYFSKLDFHSFERYHNYNFENYIDFLNSNGLDHIFNVQKNYKFGESFMEKQVPITVKPISCMESLSYFERVIRLLSCLPYVFHKAISTVSR
mgnify:CR=1 FL=1